jgi:hypothetical protein
VPDTYEDYMEIAAFYAWQADTYRAPAVLPDFGPLTRKRFIRDKQDTSAAWARAAQKLQEVQQ